MAGMWTMSSSARAMQRKDRKLYPHFDRSKDVVEGVSESWRPSLIMNRVPTNFGGRATILNTGENYGH